MDILKAVVGLFFVTSFWGCSSKISNEDATKAIKKIIPGNFEIVSLRPLKELSGINEAVLKIDKQLLVVYVDKKGKYIITGNVMITDTQQNITLEAQRRFAGR